ncbi:fatty-acyl-CoA synthase [Streptomyces avidinii]
MLDRLDHALRARPDRPAVLTATRTGATRTAATRGELIALADAFAAALHARGLRAGDTVGVAVRPGPRALAVLLALWRLGLRGAVLDPGAGPDVLRARLASARPALVLADAAAQAVAGWARPLARRAAGLELPDLAGLGAPVATVGRRLPGCAPALDLGATRAGVPAPFTGDGDAVIVFTSGTTSKPRAVVHTRSSLAAGMETVAALFSGPGSGAGSGSGFGSAAGAGSGFGADSGFGAGPGSGSGAVSGFRSRDAWDTDPAPVLGGTFFILVPSLTRGAPVALPARSPRVLARQLARLRPRDTYLTPPQLRDALRAGARFGGRVWTGSAPASAELLGQVRESGAEEAWGVYALTELFPAAAVESREKAAHEGPGDLVGAPLPGVRAEPDADGQLLLAGAAARHRYLDEEPDPWVRTGDRARLDGSGRIVLEGRAKDMVLRRAENIYPGLYEPSLHVRGVELGLLVGVPAGDGDERLVAVVQPCRGTTERALRAALAGPLRRMGAARPDELLFARIPLSGRSRKPDRAATAALASRLLGSPAARSAPGSGPASGSTPESTSRARDGGPS